MSSGFTGNKNPSSKGKDIFDRDEKDDGKLKPKVVRIGKSTEKSVN